MKQSKGAELAGNGFEVSLWCSKHGEQKGTVCKECYKEGIE